MGSSLAAWVDRALSLTPARAAAFGLRELAALLLPTSCALCQAPDHRLCPRCARQLVAQLHLPPLGPALRCRLELPQHQELFLVCAAGLYANELAQAILAFKNRQRVFLAAQFAPYPHRAFRGSRCGWCRFPPHRPRGPGADTGRCNESCAGPRPTG